MPHYKHITNKQDSCRQKQQSLSKTKLISSIVSNHLYKCPDAYKSQTLIRAFSLVPHIGSYKHTCTVLQGVPRKVDTLGAKVGLAQKPLVFTPSVHFFGTPFSTHVKYICALMTTPLHSAVGQNANLAGHKSKHLTLIWWPKTYNIQ